LCPSDRAHGGEFRDCPAYIPEGNRTVAGQVNVVIGDSRV
jgi:hypothetical protein